MSEMAFHSAEKELKRLLLLDPVTGFARAWSPYDLFHYMAERVHDTFRDYEHTRNHCPSLLMEEGKKFPKRLAEAICYPDKLHHQQLGAVIRIYGNLFHWRTGDEEESGLSILLDQLPGGSQFRMARNVSWDENMRIRLLKLPVAERITFTAATMRKHPGKSGAPYRQKFAEEIGSLGFVENYGAREGGFGALLAKELKSTTYYFDDDEAMVLAKLKY